MPREMTATAVKRHILALLDDVAAGEEIVITKHGRTVARLVPASGPAGLRGRAATTAKTADGITDDDLFTTGVVWDLP